jgi:hypothetical protein
MVSGIQPEDTIEESCHKEEERTKKDMGNIMNSCLRLGLVAHAYFPSYSGGDPEDCYSRPSEGKA